MIQFRSLKKKEFEAMYDLRWRVLRKSLGKPRGTEKSTKENISYHVIAFDTKKKKVVGTGSLTPHGKIGEINFIAVDKDYRKKGIGKKIMLFLHKKAEKKKYKLLFLEARRNAVKFYKKLGYITKGNFYIHPKDGIKNIRMEFNL